VGATRHPVLRAVGPHPDDPRSVRDMQLTLGATVLLVMLVVFVFLRRLTPTIAVGITVPLSLAGPAPPCGSWDTRSTTCR